MISKSNLSRHLRVVYETLGIYLGGGRGLKGSVWGYGLRCL